VLLGILARLIVPQGGQELADREGAGDLAMLAADLLPKLSLPLLEILRVAAQRPHRPAWQAASTGVEHRDSQNFDQRPASLRWATANAARPLLKLCGSTS
jgi:hypothetical protein